MGACCASGECHAQYGDQCYADHCHGLLHNIRPFNWVRPTRSFGGCRPLSACRLRCTGSVSSHLAGMWSGASRSPQGCRQARCVPRPCGAGRVRWGCPRLHVRRSKAMVRLIQASSAMGLGGASRSSPHRLLGRRLSRAFICLGLPPGSRPGFQRQRMSFLGFHAFGSRHACLRSVV